jgi:spore maturation protein CgeB
VDRTLVGRYALYLSFTGGPARERKAALGSPRVRPLYCAVDPDAHRPTGEAPAWDLGYLGTYAADRQPALEELLVGVAARQANRRFVVAGPLYPAELAWPANLERIEHLPPAAHSSFYSRQRFTLNLTRGDMKRLGYSPSVRLFEAAACGAAIVSDVWEGLGEFFEPFTEILPVRQRGDVEAFLNDLPEEGRVELGRRARAKVLARHTAAARAAELEAIVRELIGGAPARPRRVAAEAPVSP